MLLFYFIFCRIYWILLLSFFMWLSLQYSLLYRLWFDIHNEICSKFLYMHIFVSIVIYCFITCTNLLQKVVSSLIYFKGTALTWLSLLQSRTDSNFSDLFIYNCNCIQVIVVDKLCSRVIKKKFYTKLSYITCT